MCIVIQWNLSWVDTLLVVYYIGGLMSTNQVIRYMNIPYILLSISAKIVFDNEKNFFFLQIEKLGGSPLQGRNRPAQLNLVSNPLSDSPALLDPAPPQSPVEPTEFEVGT